MPKRDRAVLKKVSVSLPFGLGSAEWQADGTERRAAWSLYVELVTRVAAEPLAPDEGMLREALASLHALFAVTREVLREAGPDVGASAASVGGIAIQVLNRGLRPFLARWHPRLLTWEAQRTPGADPVDHERRWPHAAELRRELEKLRGELTRYAGALAQIAGAEPSPDEAS